MAAITPEAPGNLEKRLWEHENDLGAAYTKSRLPVKLVYCEEYDRVDDAFAREKQIQGWNRRKKKALIEENIEELIEYSKNYTEYGNTGDILVDRLKKETPDQCLLNFSLSLSK
jgi:putative endonuclease